MNDLDPIDRRLAELGRATLPIRARAGFRERVMLAALAESGWQRELLRTSLRLIPIAAIAAAAALGWALATTSATEAAIAVADDSLEVLWW
jgi:hypothetical protein